MSKCVAEVDVQDQLFVQRMGKRSKFLGKQTEEIKKIAE